MAHMDFWVSIGSTYSYLTVMRIEDVAAREGVDVRWRPFNVRDIMIEQQNIPFMNKPVKTAYMWRDIARRAAVHGLPVSLPAPYPLPELPLANAVAILGQQEGWGAAYIRETYRRWFVDGQRPGEPPNLNDSLTALGLQADDVLERARTPETAAALSDETEIAKSTGVFGSPSFVVGDEVFWGDDRLEAAIDWATGARRL